MSATKGKGGRNEGKYIVKLRLHSKTLGTQLMEAIQTWVAFTSARVNFGQ